MNLTARLCHWLAEVFWPSRQLQRKYRLFKDLLQHDQACLELLTDLEELGRLRPPVDWARVESLARRLCQAVAALIQTLQAMHPGRYTALTSRFDQIVALLPPLLNPPPDQTDPPYTLSLAEAAQHPALVGGKAWALGRVQQEAGLPTPPGFVITTRAYGLFLAYNNLRPRLNQLLAEVTLDDWDGLSRLADEMTALIRQAQIPPVLATEIAARLKELSSEGWPGPWIARSSAVSEDGELSFAGQYTSLPNLTEADLLAAYKEVVASKYSARAVSYRLRSGLLDQETPMAVLVLAMLEAVVSGVIYTRALSGRQDEPVPLNLYAVCGHCQQLVDGTVIPEVLSLTRETPPRLHEPWSQAGSCLLPAVAVALAAWGLRLEELFGAPQDIEWCLDKSGQAYILQSRPLHDHGANSVGEAGAPHPAAGEQRLLLAGGMTASPGIGAGRVFILQNETALGQVPAGSVLVTTTLSPLLAGIIDQLRAVVAESGSPASHFASVAREFGLPVICGLAHATRLLAPGTQVIVDADNRGIYEGGENMVMASRPKGWESRSPFQARLQQVLAVIAPLHLLDPTSPNFRPEDCRSLHDLIRFCHEMGMVEMFSLGGRRGQSLGRARPLLTDLPLTVYVLELEPCLAPAPVKTKGVAVDQILSPPFQACWQGLTHPDVVWHRGLKYLDWERLDQISAGLMSLKSAGLASYALLAPDYLHLLLRFGYHLAVLDTLCSDRPDANYIAFRFKGGGGQYENRLRRLRFIEAILLWAGFQVKTQGDLLEARVARLPADAILSRLTLWGVLQGKCQLLDLALADEADVTGLVASFQERYKHLLL